MTGDETSQDRADGWTLAAAGLASGLQYSDLPADIIRLAKLCFLDTIGVALAAVGEEAPRILLEEMREEGGKPAAGVFGFHDRLPALAAALVNGTMAHAIDYDDVTMIVPGHLSAVLVPALLAMAEQRLASGTELIAAFVSGYETCCRLGLLMSPGHYAAGFHATGTIGAVGAAAGCGRLLGLDAATCAHAMGIATTQAAGLKSMMGTMSKPLHAGRAAYNGLLSARLAGRGYTSRPDGIECAQGFLRTHGTNCNANALAEPPGRFHLARNLFKYHAACMMTHASIEALRGLRDEHGLRPDRIRSITIRIDRVAEGVCSYPAPRTGLEAKFSLPAAAALTLSGRDTGDPATYNDAIGDDPEIGAISRRVTVDYQVGWDLTDSEVVLRLIDGTVLSRRYNAGIPPADVGEQSRRVEKKFLALASRVVGAQRARRLAEDVLNLERLPNVAVLSALWTPASGQEAPLAD